MSLPGGDSSQAPPQATPSDSRSGADRYLSADPLCQWRAAQRPPRTPRDPADGFSMATNRLATAQAKREARPGRTTSGEQPSRRPFQVVAGRARVRARGHQLADREPRAVAAAGQRAKAAAMDVGLKGKEEVLTAGVVPLFGRVPMTPIRPVIASSAALAQPSSARSSRQTNKTTGLVPTCCSAGALGTTRSGRRHRRPASLGYTRGVRSGRAPRGGQCELYRLDLHLERDVGLTSPKVLSSTSIIACPSARGSRSA